MWLVNADSRVQGARELRADVGPLRAAVACESAGTLPGRAWRQEQAGHTNYEKYSVHECLRWWRCLWSPGCGCRGSWRVGTQEPKAKTSEGRVRVGGFLVHPWSSPRKRSRHSRDPVPATVTSAILSDDYFRRRSSRLRTRWTARLVAPCSEASAPRLLGAENLEPEALDHLGVRCSLRGLRTHGIAIRLSDGAGRAGFGSCLRPS